MLSAELDTFTLTDVLWLIGRAKRTGAVLFDGGRETVWVDRGDVTGIGSDFDGVDYTPVGLEDVSKFPDLFAELIRRGWSDGDLKKLAGQNLLRVLRQAEATAARLQREREPSTGTIEQLDGGKTTS